MALYAARMITNKVRLSAAQTFFQPDGAGKLFNLGDGQSLVYTPEIQEWENWTRQHGTKQLAGTYPIQKSATVAFSTLSWTELVYRMMYVSNGGYVEQEAAPSKPVTFDAPVAGDILESGVKKATVTSADDGAEEDAIVWVEGTHFTYHGPSGLTEILAVPEGAEKLVLDLNVSAIASTDKLPKFEIMDGSGVTGRLLAIGTNQFGAKGELNVGKVKFLPSSGVASIGGDEGDTAELTGRVYIDDNGSFGTWQAYEAI